MCLKRKGRWWGGGRELIKICFSQLSLSFAPHLYVWLRPENSHVFFVYIQLTVQVIGTLLLWFAWNNTTRNIKFLRLRHWIVQAYYCLRSYLIFHFLIISRLTLEKKKIIKISFFKTRKQKQKQKIKDQDPPSFCRSILMNQIYQNIWIPSKDVVRWKKPMKHFVWKNDWLIINNDQKRIKGENMLINETHQTF